MAEHMQQFINRTGLENRGDPLWEKEMQVAALGEVYYENRHLVTDHNCSMEPFRPFEDDLRQLESDVATGVGLDRSVIRIVDDLAALNPD